MKGGVIIANASQDSVICEADLMDASCSGKAAAAGRDRPEAGSPPIGRPFSRMDNAARSSCRL